MVDVRKMVMAMCDHQVAMLLSGDHLDGPGGMVRVAEIDGVRVFDLDVHVSMRVVR